VFLDLFPKKEYRYLKSKTIYVMKKFVFLFLLMPSLAQAVETLVISYEAHEGILYEVFAATTYEGGQKVVTYTYKELAQLPKGYVFSQAELNGLGSEGATSPQKEKTKEEFIPWLKILFSWKEQKETYFVLVNRKVEQRVSSINRKPTLSSVWIFMVLAAIFSLYPAFSRTLKLKQRIALFGIIILAGGVVVAYICTNLHFPWKEGVVPWAVVACMCLLIYLRGEKVRRLQAEGRLA
jgi:hypothetical protein